MTNETKSKVSKLIPAALILASLSMLLVPGVPQAVCAVPENAWNSVTTAWAWLGATVSFLFSWI